MVNSAGDIETENVTARNKASVSVNSAGDVDVPEIVAGGMVSLSTNSAGDIKNPPLFLLLLHLSAPIHQEI